MQEKWTVVSVTWFAEGLVVLQINAKYRRWNTLGSSRSASPRSNIYYRGKTRNHYFRRRVRQSFHHPKCVIAPCVLIRDTLFRRDPSGSKWPNSTSNTKKSWRPKAVPIFTARFLRWEGDAPADITRFLNIHAMRVPITIRKVIVCSQHDLQELIISSDTRNLLRGTCLAQPIHLLY